MGFYGNITNTSNTTFQFDRIYPNRLNMDSNVNNDGIFIGRYVLVEYQQSAAYPVVYIKDNQFYSSPNCEEITRIKFLQGDRKDNTDENNDGYFDGVYKDEFVQTQQVGEDKTTIKFYQCIGAEGEYAAFTDAAPDTSKSNYITNFGIDEYHYSNEKGFKGYDSTVWVKSSVEQNGKLITKYVNIADLNSVVPTFDIAADAPTMEPITPHFDADSTNVYYKLHAQTPYGFRVKAETNKKLSDEKTKHYKVTYDKDSNIAISEPTSPDAAIYYNKEAFRAKPYIDEITGEIIPVVKKDNTTINEIKVQPSGYTDDYANKYSHKPTSDDRDLIGDIQEFSLHLPAIGNMMSDAWDIIHGPNRDDYKGQWKGEDDSIDYSSLQGRLNALSDLQIDEIPVKRLRDGQIIGSKINGGKSEQEIYGSLDDAWIQTLVDGNTNTISIHHTFNSNKNGNSYSDIRNKEMPGNDTDNNINLNDGTNTLDINTPIIDATGHVVGKNTETVTLPYGYKAIEVVNSDKVSAAPDNTDATPTADNTQDVLNLNASNKWIKFNTKDATDNNEIQIGHILKTISTTNSEQSLSSETGTTTFEVYNDSFDEAGHHKGRDTKTITMPFGYGKIKGDNNTSTAATATYDELNVLSGDSWIKTEATKDTVIITHTDPVTTNAKNESNKTPNFGDTFIIEDWVFDNKGHKANLSTHTVKIPRGSLNDLTATSSSVLTGISMVPETGVITQTHNDVGKLALIGYTTSNDRTDIGSGDTINSAFAKLQNQINYEENRINTILNGTDDLTETLDTFIELQTYVKNHGKEAADMATAIDNEIVRATNAENTNANLINQETLRAIEEEGKLNTRIDNLVGNTTVSTQIDNKINTFNSTLGSAAYTESDMYALAGSYDNRVLQSVYDAKIKELEATITALAKRIEALEVEPEIPTDGE